MPVWVESTSDFFGDAVSAHRLGAADISLRCNTFERDPGCTLVSLDVWTHPRGPGRASLSLSAWPRALDVLNVSRTGVIDAGLLHGSLDGITRQVLDSLARVFVIDCRSSCVIDFPYFLVHSGRIM